MLALHDCNATSGTMCVMRGGQGGAMALESELSFICIGFSPINDIRARGCPPLEKFLVTPMQIQGHNQGGKVHEGERE